jgi:hypothetical protein
MQGGRGMQAGGRGMHTGRRGRRLATAATAAVVLVATGCSGGGDAASCPEPTPLADPPAVSRQIQASRLGTVVAGQVAAGFVTLTIDSDLSVDELTDRLPRSLGRLGHEPLSVDDEGFEAEIYFGGPGSATSVVRVVESTQCAGRSTLQVSVSDDRVAADGSFTA